MTLDEVRSSSVSRRESGAGGMVLFCCHPYATEWADAYREQACHELQRLLETETEPLVMERLVAIDDKRPHCYARFPPSSVAHLCREGCADYTRKLLPTVLGSLDPSPEIVAALLHQLTLPLDETILPGMAPYPVSEDDLDFAIAAQLATMGEPDLWPVLAALASPNPRMRRGAALTFYLALQGDQGPLDMPALLPALERLEADSDPQTAYWAARAGRAYRWWSKSADEVVASLAQRTDKRPAIRMLAVRRFSCRTRAAGEILAHLTIDPDPRVAGAARGAIAFRAKRCAGLSL